MALHPLVSDTYGGYANQAAFEAAYPYDPPSNLSTSVSPGMVWGLTEGPGGLPGVSANQTELIFDKVNLNPQCRSFRVKGRWNFRSDSEGFPYVLAMWWVPPGARDDDFAGFLEVFRTSIGGLLFRGVTYPGVLPASTNLDIQLDGTVSTITETSPGVFAAAADGSLSLSVNGAVIVTVTGLTLWNGRTDLGGAQWNGVAISPSGKFTNLEIYDSDECTVTVIDQTHVCCSAGGGDNPPTGGGTGNGPPPVMTPEIGSQIACIGGGTVPTQADLVLAEAWWGA